jgi:hypothetical protein
VSTLRETHWIQRLCRISTMISYIIMVLRKAPEFDIA